VANTNTPTEWLQIDLGRVYDVKAVQVNYADYKSGLYGTDSAVYTAFRLQASPDGTAWTMIADWSAERRDHANAYVELAQPMRARYVRYEHVHVGARNLAISDLRVFGNGAGRPPAVPRGLSAHREADERNAMISWQPVRGVVGYNVRWGTAPDRLYETYQRWADQPATFELRALSVGQGYWVAIESFDENGVSQLSAAVPIR
jgi:xylan 1,4-beta-xylosidase